MWKVAKMIMTIILPGIVGAIVIIDSGPAAYQSLKEATQSIDLLNAIYLLLFFTGIGLAILSLILSPSKIKAATQYVEQKSRIRKAKRLRKELAKRLPRLWEWGKGFYVVETNTAALQPESMYKVSSIPVCPKCDLPYSRNLDTNMLGCQTIDCKGRELPKIHPANAQKADVAFKCHINNLLLDIERGSK